MRSHPFVTALALSLVVVSLAVAARADDKTKKSRRTTAEAMKLKGLELKKFVEIDIDGNGTKELIGAGFGEKGLRLAIIGEEKDGAVVTELLPWAMGKEIAKLEAVALAPPKESNEILFEVYDETPDEKVKRVRVYGKKDDRIREIFTSVLNRPKNAAERDAWETDKSIITYGDARGGWYFDDLEGDGVSEVLVRRKPQILTVPKGDDDAVKLMTGVREQVWRWDEANWAYKDSGERLNDFLPAYEIAKVTASSAWIEPNALREMKANALNNALMKKDGKEGSPGGELELGLEDLETPTTTPKKAPPPASTSGKGKGKGKAKEAPPPAPEEPEIEIDRSEWIVKGADKNLSTAWIEDADDDGKGQWIEVELAEESAIHMVRVVAGCVESAAAFKAHNVSESFTVQVDGGSEARIDRREPDKFDSPAVAFSDALFKVKDRPWMKTTLVFFDGKTEGKKVRITLDKAIRQGKSNQTCISEISVH